MKEQLKIIYIDNHISFTVSINLLESKSKKNHNKYVVFKPMISIISEDKQLVEEVLTRLDISKSIDMAKSKKKVGYYVRIQDFKEIEYIKARLNFDDMQNKVKVKNIKLFYQIFDILKKNGYIFKEWNENFDKLLEIKYNLNIESRTRPGFTESQWKSKIESHLRKI